VTNPVFPPLVETGTFLQQSQRRLVERDPFTPREIANLALQARAVRVA
jgi:hypothetical protein